MGHAKTFGQGLSIRININTDNHIGADKARALDHVKTDATKAEHHYIGSGFDFRRVDHSADAGGHAAADVANLIKGRVLANFSQGYLGHDRVIGEG